MDIGTQKIDKEYFDRVREKAGLQFFGLINNFNKFTIIHKIMDNNIHDFPTNHGLLETNIVNPADSVTINHALINEHRITKQFDYSSEEQHLKEHLLEVNNSKFQPKFNGIRNEIQKTYIENNLDFYCDRNEIFTEEKNGPFNKTDKETSEREFSKNELDNLISKQAFEENSSSVNCYKNENEIYL